MCALCMKKLFSQISIVEVSLLRAQAAVVLCHDLWLSLLFSHLFAVVNRAIHSVSQNGLFLCVTSIRLYQKVLLLACSSSPLAFCLSVHICKNEVLGQNPAVLGQNPACLPNGDYGAGLLHPRRIILCVSRLQVYRLVNDALDVDVVWLSDHDLTATIVVLLSAPLFMDPPVLLCPKEHKTAAKSPLCITLLPFAILCISLNLQAAWSKLAFYATDFGCIDFGWKRDAMEDGKLEKSCISFEALSGLVWKVGSKAMNILPEQQTKLLLAVDCQQRLVPPLPKGYAGNGIVLTCALRNVGDLAQGPLSIVVKLVWNAITMVIARYIRSTSDYFEVTKARPSLAASLVITTVHLMPTQATNNHDDLETATYCHKNAFHSLLHEYLLIPCRCSMLPGSHHSSNNFQNIILMGFSIHSHAHVHAPLRHLNALFTMSILMCVLSLVLMVAIIFCNCCKLSTAFAINMLNAYDAQHIKRAHVLIVEPHYAAGSVSIFPWSCCFTTFLIFWHKVKVKDPTPLPHLRP